MLRKKIKFFKKYKLNQLEKIIQNYKFIYFFRYNDLNIKELIFLKKNLNKLNYKSLIINQNLINQIILKLKGQGSILIIYGNNDLDFKDLINFKKLKLIYLKIQNNIYSFFKIRKNLNKKNYVPLNKLIIQPFLSFIYLLRKIKRRL
uniref:ymf98 n=1 Tax=Peronosclerospora sorghi TaxID=230839 RepID=UPI0022FDA7C9|nr:ymf98 [Peronosclerospora sorghi]WAU47951.1 ymf98 [Peronosclerospora sorghi]